MKATINSYLSNHIEKIKSFRQSLRNKYPELLKATNQHNENELQCDKCELDRDDMRVPLPDKEGNWECDCGVGDE